MMMLNQVLRDSVQALRVVRCNEVLLWCNRVFRGNGSNFSDIYLGLDAVHDVDKIPGSATQAVKDVQLECINVAEQLRELERKLE